VISSHNSPGARAAALLLALGAVSGAWTAEPSVPAAGARHFDLADMQSIWKDLEARGVINQRIVEGGSYSLNVRIVRPGDVPLVHADSADVWIVMAGKATAITGGELVDAARRATGNDIEGKDIRGGTRQSLQPGDIVFVPPGVPHAFRDLQGFRAYLIRFDVPAKAAGIP
jgi:mannose-6-phosphate isomerase-like protein (cupin superfamily)